MAEYEESSLQPPAVQSSSMETSQNLGSTQNATLAMQMPQQNFATGAMGYPVSYVPPPMTAQQEQLRQFWQEQMMEIHHVGTDPAEFKNHQLPLARIKKIMKSDEDVRMISAEAPVLFAKACEMFILELTLRSWNHSEENKRRTLQRNDISAAITRTDIFDFLVDIVPRDEQGEEAAAAAAARPMPAAGQFPGGVQPGPPQWSLPGQVPAAAQAAGDLPAIPRPQQAVDPAVMQFYMQQPQTASMQLPSTTGALNFFPAQNQQSGVPNPVVPKQE